MQVINSRMQDQYKEMLANVEFQKPAPIEVTLHPEGEEPHILSSGATVMAGDYYNEELGLVISSQDVGKDRVWQPIQ